MARARGLSEQAVRLTVERQTARPLFGFIGEDRVNVLALTRARARGGGRPAGG